MMFRRYLPCDLLQFRRGRGGGLAALKVFVEEAGVQRALAKLRVSQNFAKE